MTDIRSILDPLAVPNEVKAAAWDAFQSSRNDAEFRIKFAQLPLPRETKASLWDAKGFTPDQLVQPKPATPAKGVEPAMSSFLPELLGNTADYLKAPLHPVDMAKSLLTSPTDTAMTRMAGAQKQQGANFDPMAQLKTEFAGHPLTKAMQEHDLGSVAGQVAAIPASIALTEGAFKGAGAIVPKMGAAADATGGLLEKSAAEDYRKILNPTKNETKFLTKEVAPELAKRMPVSMSEAKLRIRVAGAKAAAGEAVDAAWEKIPEGETLPKKPLLDAIDGLKSKFRVEGVEVLPEATAKIDELRQIVNKFGDDIAPSSLRKVRQIWDDIVDKSGGFGGKDLKGTSETFAQKQVANALRSEIGNAYPDIKKLNAEFHFWSSVDEILNAKELRDTGKGMRLRDMFGGGAGAYLGSQAGGAAGAVVGSVLGPSLIRLVESTAWRTTSSALKLKIADLIAKGDFAGAAKAIPPEVFSDKLKDAIKGDKSSRARSEK